MLSFIIPAHNEELLLPATLRALSVAAAGLPEPCEIVVADDSSTDSTAAVARAHGARVVSIEARQIAAARNAGARAAAGDLFVFVDADTIVPPETALAAHRALRSGAAAGGCMVAFDEPTPRWVRTLLPVFMFAYRSLRLAAGCFLFCTREAFEAAGGFDETLYASEEVTMSRALKRQGRFVCLRETVTTSGRKLRTHTSGEVLGVIGRFLVKGPKMVKTRDGLEIWYGARRIDPGASLGAPAQGAPESRGAAEGGGSV